MPWFTRDVVRTLLAQGPALAFALGAGLEPALLAAAAAEALILPVRIAIAVRLARPSLRGATRTAGPLLAYGARVQGAMALGHVDQRLSGFIVAYYATAADLAFYAVAEGLVTAVLAIPTLVGSVLQPKIARQSDTDAARMTAATCRSSLFVSLGICAAIAAFRRLAPVPLREVLLVDRADLLRLVRVGRDALSLRALRAAGGGPR